MARDLTAEGCANLWVTAIQHHLAAAKRGDEDSKIWLSKDGLAVALMLGCDIQQYWDGVRDIALS